MSYPIRLAGLAGFFLKIYPKISTTVVLLPNLPEYEDCQSLGGSQLPMIKMLFGLCSKNSLYLGTAIYSWLKRAF